ncbi:ExbD/TolR family protein [Psychrobacter sp. UBA3962]|uniref:ExbD/TolR family protein n=1 Tax=Psychrobacter sp. UBA3962 TaxID=1947352 RepID=UPI0025DC2AE1|nr:biopolymer transporter ExbD [Psychrobacter sp. UBA3962]
MAFQLGDDDMQAMNEINLIPLIDIMLVLMIIFLVTATVMNPSVPLDLPQTSAAVQPAEPKVIQISIDKDAGIYWDDEPITLQQLSSRLDEQSQQQTEPSIHLRTDKDARYETVAQVLALASKAELTKIAFISE